MNPTSWSQVKRTNRPAFEAAKEVADGCGWDGTDLAEWDVYDLGNGILDMNHPDHCTSQVVWIDGAWRDPNGEGYGWDDLTPEEADRLWNLYQAVAV